MNFFVDSRWGGSEREPGESRLREILAELDVEDDEHPDTWLTHESEWTLSAFQGGRLVFSDPDGERPRHLPKVSREHALELWLLLARGDWNALEAQPWLPGEGRNRLPEDHAKRVAEIEAQRMESDRKFYDSLGEERPGSQCRASGCSRGTIPLSVLCKAHHFEAIQKRPCPV